MEEEEILDLDTTPVKVPNVWPYILLGGLAAGAVKLLFAFLAPQTSTSVQLILLILLSMIMMNTTLNFYYQKKNAARDIRTGFIICAGLYVIMTAIFRLGLLATDRYYNEFLEPWYLDVAASVMGGMLVSAVVAILSRKP